MTIPKTLDKHFIYLKYEKHRFTFIFHLIPSKFTTQFLINRFLSTYTVQSDRPIARIAQRGKKGGGRWTFNVWILSLSRKLDLIVFLGFEVELLSSYELPKSTCQQVYEMDHSAC